MYVPEERGPRRCGTVEARAPAPIKVTENTNEDTHITSEAVATPSMPPSENLSSLVEVIIAPLVEASEACSVLVMVYWTETGVSAAARPSTYA